MSKSTTLISNGLWFDSNAEEAAQFYLSVFPDAKILSTSYYTEVGYDVHKRPAGSVMAVDFVLSGMHFQALNGGPIFKINPSVSFFILCDGAKEAKQFWDRLIDGGKALMGFDNYPWSEAYGWLEDKFGVSWQIYTGKGNEQNQKIVPMLMYSGKQVGRAKEAMEFYTGIFDNSAIEGIMNYPPGGGKDKPDTVMHAQFLLSGQVFNAMDSAEDHKFSFNEGVSLIVHCANQEEIDYYWEKLTSGGQEVECGWLKDKFGVCWQVVPTELDEMMASPDKEKVARVTAAFLKMKKFDLAKLRSAFNG